MQGHAIQQILMEQRQRRKLTTVLQMVKRCPFCSKADPTFLRVWSTDGTSGTPRGDGERPQKWAAYRCASCGSVLTACGAPGSEIGNAAEPEVYAIYPAPVAVPEDIPPIAKRFLEQAVETLHAPDAAAVMAGSAVDAMLKHSGYIDGSLYSRIDKAKDDGLLTKGMADWAHSVRLGSNRPRHADDEKPHVSNAEAERSVRFARALGDFLYVLTAQIEDAVQKADEINGDG